MIEIKNKRMILYPEDRVLGAQGDIMTAERKFILDRVQDGYDLSNMICFIKLEPKDKDAFEQLVKREVKQDKIIITWTLGGAAMDIAGELSAQIIFVGTDYFEESDLDGLDDGDFVVPHRVVGNSAPVWQSHKEIFIVTESIDNSGQYVEVTKNVLLSALADAANYSQKAMEYSQNAKTSELSAKMYCTDAVEAKNDCYRFLEQAQIEASLAEENKNLAGYHAQMAQQEREKCEEQVSKAEEFSKLCSSHRDNAYIYVQEALKAEARVAEAEARVKSYNDDSAMSAYVAESSMVESMIIQGDIQMMMQEITEIYDDTRLCAISAEEAAEKAEEYLGQLKTARNYRLIYSKTLTPEDEGCISFEINQDNEGNPLNLSECVFYIYCPKTEGATGSYVKLEGVGEGNDAFARLAQFSLISANNDVYCRAECQNRGRWIVKTAKGSSWDQNAESVTAQGAVCAQSRANDGKPLTAVRLVQHSSVGVPFASGMSVEVWGIDSIKEEA